MVSQREPLARMLDTPRYLWVAAVEVNCYTVVIHNMKNSHAYGSLLSVICA
jgi:hypothetical protein